MFITGSLFATKTVDLNRMYNERAQQQGQYSSVYIPTAKELKLYGSECWDIIKALRKDQKHTAAITASSPWLIHHLTKYIPHNVPIKILEAGSGSGTVTKKIIERMHPQSQLDAVEYNKELYEGLVKQLGDKQSDSIKFYHAALEEWAPVNGESEYYDVIVSTLPITQLPLDTLKKILDEYTRMLKPGGMFVFVTLCGARTLTLFAKETKHFVTCKINQYFADIDAQHASCVQDLNNYKTILQTLRSWQQEFFTPIKTEIVFLNITPVYVMSLQKKQIIEF